MRQACTIFSFNYLDLLICVRRCGDRGATSPIHRFPAAARLLPTRRVLQAAAVGLFLLSGAGSARADAADCSADIDRAALQYESRIHKALADCAVRDATGSACNADRRDKALAKETCSLASRVSALALPRWGRSTTFSSPSNSGGTLGSAG